MILIMRLSGFLAAMTWRVPRLRIKKTPSGHRGADTRKFKQPVADSLQEAILQLGCRARGKSHRTMINQHVTKCYI